MDEKIVSVVRIEEEQDETIGKKGVTKRPRKGRQRKPKGASRVLSRNVQHEGKFVAWPSFNNRKVVATGATRVAAKKRATINGYPDAVVSYIPQQKDLLGLPSCQ